MSTWDEKAEDYASAHYTLEHQRLAYNMQRWAMFVKGARWQREQLLSEETVERAARALNRDGWTCTGGVDEPGRYDECRHCRKVCDETARAALIAALGEEGQ